MSRHIDTLPLKQTNKYALLGINSSNILHKRQKYHLNRLKMQQVNSNLSLLTKAQSQLQKQITAINVSLQRKYRNQSYKSGLIFKHEVDYHLANYIRHILDSRNQIISWGFVFDKEVLDQKQYKKERLLEKVLKANRLGIESLKLPPPQPHFIRYNNTPQIPINKWEYFSKGSTVKYYKQKQKLKTQPTIKQLHYPQLIYSFNQVLTQSTPHQKREREKDQSQISLRQSLNPPQIYELINKQQKFISIWLPPSSNGQLLGLITFLIHQRQDSSQVCMIRKYWWLRKYINKPTFNCILDWICSQFGYIDELTLLTNQQNFDSIFAPIGWKLTNWMQEQKLRISYKRTLL